MSDDEALYELVSLGTRYSALITAFSRRLQARGREVNALNEKITSLQQHLHVNNMKMASMKREIKELKSLMSSAYRLPSPLDLNDMRTFEEQERLKSEVESLKFL